MQKNIVLLLALAMIALNLCSCGNNEEILNSSIGQSQAASSKGVSSLTTSSEIVGKEESVPFVIAYRSADYGGLCIFANTLHKAESVI